MADPSLGHDTAPGYRKIFDGRPTPNVAMGHAGAIVSASGESAEEKVAMLGAAGIAVVPDPSSIGGTVEHVLREYGLLHPA